MRNRFPITALAIPLAFASAVSVFAEPAPMDQVRWSKTVLNAESDYEAAGVGDVNGDGVNDIVCGAWWYEGPDWKNRHKVAAIEKQGSYYNDFANELTDVDGDGDLDVVSCAWFSREVFWRENPGEAGGEWKTHVIDEPGNMETAMLMDLNGDQLDDIVPNCVQVVAWYERLAQPAGDAYFGKREVCREHAGHGVGAGDLNGDGVMDILCPTGWYEGAKTDSGEMEWTWRPEWNLGTASIPILVYDVNGDGDNDVVWGMGHNYGLYWLEQAEENGRRMWWRHTIDESWSQPHFIEAADINRDGKLDLVAGKRYYAHDGKDPGGNDPLCVYVYDYNRESGEWARHAVSEGGRAGFGLHPAIDDVDKDGDLDLVLPGKSGLYLFSQD